MSCWLRRMDSTAVDEVAEAQQRGPYLLRCQDSWMSGAGHDEDECEIGPGAGHQPEESADVETAKVDRSAGLLFVLKAAGYEKAAEDEEDRNSMLTDAICVGDMQSDVESNYDVAHQNRRTAIRADE